jgi:hypothetical protein
MDISIIILAGIAVALCALIGAAIAIYVIDKEESLPAKTAVVKPTARSMGYVAPELAKRHVSVTVAKQRPASSGSIQMQSRTARFRDTDYDAPIIPTTLYIDSSPVYDTPTTRSYDSYDSCSSSSSSSYDSSDSSSCSSSSD